jgi:hypothetical protein
MDGKPVSGKRDKSVKYFVMDVRTQEDLSAEKGKEITLMRRGRVRREENGEGKSAGTL